MVNSLSSCIRRCLMGVAVLSSVMVFDSCERIDISEEEIGQSGQIAGNEVRVTTRAASELAYPLTLYAFSGSNGQLIASVSVDDETDGITFTLPSGQYHLVAVAGLDECAVPVTPTLSDCIVLPANGRLEGPLQMGSADVPVNGDVTVSITMYNQVAAVGLSLEGLPVDVSSVNVTLSMLRNCLSFGGAFSGDAATTVQLQREESDNVWTAPRFYVFPGSGDRLTLSITTVSPSGTQTYGYTHAGTLKANTPYDLVGHYTDGFMVNSVISLAGWNGTEEILFNLGGEESEESGGGSSAVIGGEVAAFPEVGSLWNGHFVALSEVEDNGMQARLLLLSLSEWTGVPSAINEDEPDLAVELATEYVEENLSGWYIPTREEVKAMRASIGGTNLSATNVRLSEYGAVLLSDGVKDLEGNNIRYLCDDGAFSFTWTGSNISTCGSRRTYNLRMVKSVTVSLK